MTEKISTVAGGLDPTANAPLSVQDTIAQLSFIRRGQPPRQALQSAIAGRDEITPLLLDEISLAPVDVQMRYRQETDANAAYYLHTLSFFLLALFRDPGAFALMLDYYASDCDLAEELSGDALGGFLPSMLVRCYDGGDLRQLRLMIETEAYEPTFRHECFQAYHGLALAGYIDRAQVVAFAERLLDKIPADATYDRWYVWLALAVAELQEPALRARIEALFDRGLTQEGTERFFLVADKADIDKTYSDKPSTIADSILMPSFFDNFVERICRWYWFQAPREDRPSDRAERAYHEHTYDAPYVRTLPKVGRNDPCLCGSGLKYKKCCLN